MCLLVVRSCCISLETCLTLKSDYIKQFSFFVCVTVVLADVSCGLIDVQAAIYKMCLENLLFSTHSLGDDQCVDVMNKTSLLMSSECLIYSFLVALHH